MIHSFRFVTSFITDAGTDAAGVVILLKYPYPRDVLEPVQYDSIRVHAQMGHVTVDSDRLRLSVSALSLSESIAKSFFGGVWAMYTPSQENGTTVTFLNNFIYLVIYLVQPPGETNPPVRPRA